MEIFDFALSLIRAPWATRLKDRTFQTLIFTAITALGGAIVAWRSDIPINDKVNLTFAALGAIAAVGSAFTIGDKQKDSAIATAALHALETIKTQEIITSGPVNAPDKAPSTKEIGLGLLSSLADKEVAKLQEKAVREQEAENADD